MKKYKWISGLLAIVAFGFVACGNTASGGTPTIQQVRPKNYYEITEENNTISVSLDAKYEAYMFLYNMSDTSIDKSVYKEILNNDTNFESKSITNTDYCNYDCSLSLDFVRDAYKYRNPTLASMTSREASTSDPYRIEERSRNKKAATLDSEANFHLSYFNNNNTELKTIKAICKYVNDDSPCQIFVESGYYTDASSDKFTIKEDGKVKVTSTGVNDIATKFRNIYDSEQALLGYANTNPDYLDGKNYTDTILTPEKITILIADIGTSSVMGYFYSMDLDCKSENGEGKYYYNDKWTAYSNERLMFTLNKNALENYPERMYSTLGHEFNHMLNYINKELKNNTFFNFVWFTEMLSTITEDFTPYYLYAGTTNTENVAQYGRIVDFFNTPNLGMIDWDDSYGFAYAFGAYLVRNYGGVKLVHELATNPYYGKKAITEALKTCGYNEDYDSVLSKFGVILANADGADKSSPTLKKTVRGSYGSYTYNFPEIDLYNFVSYIAYGDEALERYDNPNWIPSNPVGGKTYPFGPLFLSYEYSWDNIKGGGFSATYLGKFDSGNHSKTFTPPANSNIKAYIYLKKAKN